MRTRMITIALATAVSMTMATGAMAAPPLGDGDGDTGHPHHVHTGDGGCVDVDAVKFLIEERGLHRGAAASGTEQGIWHGTCH